MTKKTQKNSLLINSIEIVFGVTLSKEKQLKVFGLYIKPDLHFKHCIFESSLEYIRHSAQLL